MELEIIMYNIIAFFYFLLVCRSRSEQKVKYNFKVLVILAVNMTNPEPRLFSKGPSVIINQSVKRKYRTERILFLKQLKSSGPTLPLQLAVFIKSSLGSR